MSFDSIEPMRKRAAIYDAFWAEGRLEDRVNELLVAAKMNRSLSDLSVDQSMIPQLGEEAAGQWTAQFNPVDVTSTRFGRSLYQCLVEFSPRKLFFSV